MNLLKNTLLVASLAIAFAAKPMDRMVAPGGSGNIYPTIISAIEAANSGDRIIIAPGVYPGTITITKSLSLLSNSPGQRYTINGSIALLHSAAQVTLTISSMRLNGGIYENMTNVTGSIRIIDSVITGDVSITGEAGITCQLHRDSLLSYVNLTHGVVTGCHLTCDNLPSGYGAYNMSAFLGVPASARLIGNVIGKGATATTGSMVNVTPNGRFEVRNNVFVTNTATHVGPLVLCQNSSLMTNDPCVFENNSMIHAGTGNPVFLRVNTTSNALNLSVRNNLFVGSSQPVSTASPSVEVAYNITTMSTAQVDQNTGAPAPGSPAINGGDPDALYTDLDLTRNDAGCYGGSFSRDNFDDPLTSSAAVLFLDAPRRTQAAYSMQLKAEGFDR